jgi:hypothetical protein
MGDAQCGVRVDRRIIPSPFTDIVQISRIMREAFPRIAIGPKLSTDFVVKRVDNLGEFAVSN